MGTVLHSAARSLPSTDGEIAELNRGFDGKGPADVIRWAAGAGPEGRVAMSSTFGVGGMILLHILHEEQIRLPILFVDTLYHFPETLEHAARVAERYRLDLRILTPAPSRLAFEEMHGERLWEVDEARFHHLTKVEPMQRALEGFDVWVTGRRRDQSPTRAALPVLERTSLLKVNPLAGWSLEQVWDFIRKHDVPYHPLHDQGYASIGDEPLTTPVQPGEHERAGRWRGSERLECGLHQI